LRYAIRTSGLIPEESQGDSFLIDNIVYEPVDFALTGDCTLGEVILAKGIDEERTKDYVLPCDGRILKIAEYAPIYSLLGNTFGGDGKTTFALPNYNSSTPIYGAKYYIRIVGVYPINGF
jgi:hypothetical protein